MSDLLEAIKKAVEREGESAVQNLAEGWLDDLIDEGQFIPIDDGIDKEDAARALNLLEENKEPFIRLGQLGLARVVAHWDSDDESEARRVYLATEATFEERRLAMQAAGDAAVAEREEREAAWESVKSTLIAIGSAGLKFLVQLLLTRLPV